MKTKRLTLDLPEEIHQEFKMAAVFKNTTMKDILMVRMKEVIKEYKEEQEEKRIQSK